MAAVYDTIMNNMEITYETPVCTGKSLEHFTYWRIVQEPFRRYGAMAMIAVTGPDRERRSICNMIIQMQMIFKITYTSSISDAVNMEDEIEHPGAEIRSLNELKEGITWWS